MNLTYDPLDPRTYGTVITGGGGTVLTANGRTNITTSATVNKIQIDGDAVFEGNITWQDRDMREWFESVESRLAILKPNPELEAEWSELAELRIKYVELERELLAKQRTFDILQKS
jgi:hypothetical protein